MAAAGGRVGKQAGAGAGGSTAGVRRAAGGPAGVRRASVMAAAGGRVGKQAGAGAGAMAPQAGCGDGSCQAGGVVSVRATRAIAKGGQGSQRAAGPTSGSATGGRGAQGPPSAPTSQGAHVSERSSKYGVPIARGGRGGAPDAEAEAKAMRKIGACLRSTADLAKSQNADKPSTWENVTANLPSGPSQELERNHRPFFRKGALTCKRTSTPERDNGQRVRHIEGLVDVGNASPAPAGRSTAPTSGRQTCPNKTPACAW